MFGGREKRVVFGVNGADMITELMLSDASVYLV